MICVLKLSYLKDDNWFAFWTHYKSHRLNLIYDNLIDCLLNLINPDSLKLFFAKKRFQHMFWLFYNGTGMMLILKRITIPISCMEKSSHIIAFYFQEFGQDGFASGGDRARCNLVFATTALKGHKFLRIIDAHPPFSHSSRTRYKCN